MEQARMENPEKQASLRAHDTEQRQIKEQQNMIYNTLRSLKVLVNDRENRRSK